MRLLQLIFIGLLFTTAGGCGGSDDDGPGSGNEACTFDLISVTEIDNGNFLIRLENTSSVDYFLAIDLIYINNGVQRGNTGIGLVQDFEAGTTVDVETVTGDLLERDVDFDCVQLKMQIIVPGASGFCFDDRVGEDCY